MYHFCSASDASMGKSSNVGLTNFFHGRSHPQPKDNLDMSGVIEEINVCSEDTERESTSKILSKDGVCGVL